MAGPVPAVHRGCLPAALPTPAPVAPQPVPVPAKVPDTADTPAGRHARRLFESVHALTDTGRSYTSTARKLGLNWRTVAKYARATTWRECIRRPRSRPRTPSGIDPYLSYLRQAKVIRHDKAAVVQGITSPFSSGTNEGRITDVKLQKRVMAGRAGVALLRQRVALIAHLRRRYPGHSILRR